MNNIGEKTARQSMLYSFLKLTLGPVVRGTWVGSVTGLENLPKVGPAIIASNHASHLDFLLLSTVSTRQIQFMAGEIFYNNPIIGKAFEAMGHIKVCRGKAGDVSVMRKAVQKLEQGHFVAIYPEGTRSRSGKLQKARSGIGFLAVETGVPVIPVFLEGTHLAWPKHRRLPAPHKCVIRIGEPLRFGKSSGKEPRKDYIHAATHEVMQSIARLGDVEYRW